MDFCLTSTSLCSLLHVFKYCNATCLSKVQIFSYTEHIINGKMADKIGSCCLLRRSATGQDILLFLLRTGKIIQVTSDILTKLLEAEGTTVRKTLSKAGKIRQMMTLPRVQHAVPRDRLEWLESQLVQLEKRRKKKDPAEAVVDNEDEVLESQ